MLNLNKSTRYALYAAMEMASRQEEDVVTAAEVAERYRIPSTVAAKVLQQLVRGGLAVGTRGSGGGYRLARSPNEMTLLDVIEAFEPARAPGECLLDHDGDGSCHHDAECRLRRVFDEVDELSRATFASITLETLTGRSRTGPPPAPLRSPPTS